MPLLSLNEGLMKLSQVLLQMGKHIHPIEEGTEEKRREETRAQWMMSLMTTFMPKHLSLHSSRPTTCCCLPMCVGQCISHEVLHVNGVPSCAYVVTNHETGLYIGCLKD